MIDRLLESLANDDRHPAPEPVLRIDLPSRLPPDTARRRLEASRSLVLPVQIASRLAALGRNGGGTRDTALLAAFNMLLFRLSAQPELVVCTPAASTPAVHLRIDGALSFDDVLRRVHESIAASGEASSGPAIANASPSNVGFLPSVDRLFPGASLSFDIALRSADDPAGLRCVFLYATNCFESATIERWLQSLCGLIGEIVNAPNAPNAKLPILGATEREQLLCEWNPAPSRGAGDGLLAARFEAHVAREPNAIAVVTASERWTYRRLNARANQLARALRERDVGAGHIVAVASTRSICTIVSMLAIVKAGAAYLPLDPSYPVERLQFMFADARAHMLIAQASIADQLAGLTAADCCIDFDTFHFDAYAPGDLASAGDPDDVAYIMYTSGTTGRPKGVLVTQRGITNLVTATSALAIYPSDVVAQLANVSFDAATYEIWGALLNGARLVIAARETMLVPDSFAAWLCEERVSVAFVTSALLRHISRGSPAAFATLRCLIAGGDIVDPATVRTIRAHGPPKHLINGYGPTETTTFATTFEITEAGDAAIPIGRPLPNVQTYILDADRHPVPIGVRGQLHIGGVGLARGYINDPDLTARKFIRHPFSADPRSRLYATGDVARYRADGNIEFLGRSDRQVKVRGFRIELEEIQAALLELPGVADAVITIGEDASGEKCIAAYVIDNARPHRESSDWRALLRQRLPDYMVPSVISAVATIPLNANGKVDTAALADLPRLRASVTSADEAPHSPVEEAIATIVGDVLGIRPAARSANFFMLGGHSLLAMRAVARIRERFGVDLALRDFFAEPTVAGLAAMVAAAPLTVPAASTTIDPRVANPTNETQSVALSCAQRRLWLLAELEPDAVTYNVPYAFRLSGRLDRAALTHALNAVVRRHDILRSTVSVIDGEPAYIVRRQSTIDVPFVEIASATALDEVLLCERERPFDLRTSLPLRALVVGCAPDEHVLLVTMHHIATDGWSMGVFKRELSLFYAAERNAQTFPLDEPAVTYADFARRERQQLGSDAFAERLAYWTTLLRDPPPPLEFTGEARGLAPEAVPGRLRSRTLAAATREALRQFCRRRGSTEFSVLLAAFAVLLHGATARRDFIIGTVLANRTLTVFEGLIGFFVNTLALRVRIADDPAFAAFLTQIERSTLEAFDRQDVPFQTVVEVLRPVRVATQTPLLNVMFVLQNAPDATLDLAGLEVKPLPLERTTAKFDLTLEVTIGTADELHLALEYRTDLFDEPAIDALLAALETIVSDGISAPERPLSHWLTPEISAAQRRAGEVAPTPAPGRRTALKLGREPAVAAIAHTEAHIALRSIWEQVLGVEPIGMHDNFFDLGGHSLLAVRLIGEIDKTFHLRLPLSLLFKSPTIDGFVQALREGGGSAAADPIATYNAGGNARPVFFLHGSIGGGFYCRALADRLGPNRPFHILRPQGTGADRLLTSIEAIAAEHIALIKQLAPHGPYLLGGFCAGGLTAFELARQLRAGGDDVAKLVLLDVPDAPRALRAVVDFLDRAAAVLRLEPRRRQRLRGALARLPHHAARFVASPEKFAFLVRRFRRLAAGPLDQPGEARPDPVFAAWIRLTEAYVPRPYDGRMTLLTTRPHASTSDRGRDGWSTISPHVDERFIAGTHLTCITEFLDETAAAFADALADEP